jgi:transcriptional regulator GlxA family with amidase domain
MPSASDAGEARKLCDRAVQPLVASAPAPDPAVRLAVLAINASCGMAPVTPLGSQAGISARQLQRRFVRATGLTLKTYARIRRLRSSLTHLLEPSPRGWGAVAADFGFADQAHLIREFRRLAGATPGEIAEYVAGIKHEAVRP